MNQLNPLSIILSDLCKELNVSYSLVSKIISKNPLNVQTLCYFANAKPAKNFSYPVEYAPCSRVFKNSYYCIAHSTTIEFPNDIDLKKLSIEAYAGIVLKKNQQLVGHLAVFDSKPFNDESRIQKLLRTYGKQIETIV